MATIGQVKKTQNRPRIWEGHIAKLKRIQKLYAPDSQLPDLVNAAVRYGIPKLKKSLQQ